MIRTVQTVYHPLQICFKGVFLFFLCLLFVFFGGPMKSFFSVRPLGGTSTISDGAGGAPWRRSRCSRGPPGAS